MHPRVGELEMKSFSCRCFLNLCLSWIEKSLQKLAYFRKQVQSHCLLNFVFLFQPQGRFIFYFLISFWSWPIPTLLPVSFYHVHEHKDACDWLVLFWLTGERGRKSEQEYFPSPNWLQLQLSNYFPLTFNPFIITYNAGCSSYSVAYLHVSTMLRVNICPSLFFLWSV